jgi:hypothetical protein
LIHVNYDGVVIVRLIEDLMVTSRFVRRLAGLALALLATLLTCGRAYANPLYLTDWQSTGDQKILVDSVSGLDWLRIPNTAGMSFFSVTSALNGGWLNGWRLATRAEVSQLACDDAWGCDGTSSGSLVQLLGVTSYCPLQCRAEYVYGSLFWTADSGNEISWQGPGGSIPLMGRYSLVANGALENPVGYGSGYDARYGWSYLGTALVREAAVVPEPGSIALFSIGLAGLATTRRRAGVSGVVGRHRS